MGETTLFALGQRWLSDTETDLGLGTIIYSTVRTLNRFLFPATGETTRLRKPNSARLTVFIEVGDTISMA